MEKTQGLPYKWKIYKSVPVCALRTARMDQTVQRVEFAALYQAFVMSEQGHHILKVPIVQNR